MELAGWLVGWLVGYSAVKNVITAIKCLLTIICITMQTVTHLPFCFIPTSTDLYRTAYKSHILENVILHISLK
jgi:hypothetical protein